MSATMLYSLASIYHLWGLSEHAARTSRRRWKQDYQPPLKPLLLGGLRFFLKTFSRHGERVSWFPRCERVDPDLSLPLVLRSAAPWRCSRSCWHQCNAMSCNVTLRYVMLCYVILSLGFQAPLKPWGVSLNHHGLNYLRVLIIEFGSTAIILMVVEAQGDVCLYVWQYGSLGPPPRSSLVHAAGHGRWAVRPGVMHRWTWRWINICKAPIFIMFGLLKPGIFGGYCTFFFLLETTGNYDYEIWVEIQK